MVYRKIGAVARELHLSERRIREYERAGLLRPRRDARTGDRVFDERDLLQLRLIKYLIREKGFTLRSLRELLRYAPCWELTGCILKDSCPAARDPNVPCYQQRAAGAPMPCDADCRHCLVYRSKEQPRPRLVIPAHHQCTPT